MIYLSSSKISAIFNMEPNILKGENLERGCSCELVPGINGNLMSDVFGEEKSK